MSGFSPEFIAAVKRPVGWITLTLRLPLALLIAPVRIIGVLLQWAGQLGETLIDLHDDWRHELWCLTSPPVWSELKRLRDRCERAEERLRLLGATVEEDES